MRSQILAAAVAAALVAVAGFIAPPSANGAAVDTKRLIAARSPENAGQWMSYGRDYTEQRYSPLKLINAATGVVS